MISHAGRGGEAEVLGARAVSRGELRTVLVYGTPLKDNRVLNPSIPRGILLSSVRVIGVRWILPHSAAEATVSLSWQGTAEEEITAASFTGILEDESSSL